MESKKRTYTHSVGKRVLSIFLSLLMVVGVFAMDTGLFKLTVNAVATNARYKVRVLIVAGNDFTPSGNNNYAYVNYTLNDGSGNTGTYAIKLNNSDGKRTDIFDSGGNNYGYLPSEDGVWIDGFPTSVYATMTKNSGPDSGWFTTDGRFTVYLQVWNANGWGDYGGTDESGNWLGNIRDSYKKGVCSFTWEKKGGNGTVTTTPVAPDGTTYPKLVGTPSITTPARIIIATNAASNTGTITVSNATDQYGTVWRPTWGFISKDSNANVAISDGTITASASSDGLDYTFRAQASWATSNTGATNAQKNITASGGTTTVYVPHTITVNPNGGTYNNKTTNSTFKANTYVSTISELNSYTTLGAATKTGYTFKEWTTNGGTINGSRFYAANHNSTITAQWEPNTYIIYYNGNTNTGGSVSQTDAVYDQNVTIASNGFQKTGYHFTGWNTKADGTGDSYTAGGTYKNILTGGSMTLYAQWEKNTYTIVYKANGGTGADQSQTATFDSNVTLKGKIFTRKHTVSYNYNGATSGNTKSSDSADATLSYWNADSNAKSGYTPGATLTKPNLVNENGGSTTLYAIWTFGSVTLPTPEKTGYTFDAWYKESSFTNKVGYAGDSVELSANVTYYAHWNANQYTVTLVKNGGTGGDNSVTATYDSAMPEIDPPTLDGFIFEGYYENANGTGTQYYDKDGKSTHQWDQPQSANIYAKWSELEYDVIYTDGQGNTITDDNNGSHYKYSDTVTIKESNLFTRAGYNFSGWKGEDNKTYDAGQDYTKLASGKDTFTITAQWTPKTYTIKYENGASDASGTAPADQTVTYDQENMPDFSANTFSRTGYDFAGWVVKDKTPKTSASGKVTNAFLTDNAGTDTTITLVATWTVQSRTVIFQVNGGKWDDDTTDDKSFTKKYGYTGADVTFNNPTREGYEFTGWSITDTNVATVNLSIEKTTAVFKGTDTKTTLAAQWKAVEYDVIYNVNTTAPVTGTAANTHVTYDKAYTLAGNVLSRTGYTFEGWSKTPGDSNSVDYDYGASLTNELYDGGKNITLYAVWNPIIYTIIYDGDGADSGSMDSQEVTYSDSISDTFASNGFTKDGYFFNNWKLGANTYAADAAITPSFLTDNANEDNETTVTANWTAITYTVTYDANGGTGTVTGASMTVEQLSDKVFAENSFIREGYAFSGWKVGTTDVNEGDAVTKAILVNNGVRNTDTAYTVTVVAQWTPKTYVIHFNKNGGEGAMADQSIGYEAVTADTKLTANTFTRTGYTYNGWKLGTADVADGAAITKDWLVANANADNEITLNAQWTANTYIVQYDLNYETSAVVADLTYTYDAVNKVQPNQTRAGYDFLGWSENPNAKTGTYTNQVDTGNDLYHNGNGATLYAIWTPHIVTLTVHYYDGEDDIVRSIKFSETVDLSEYKITRDGFDFAGWTLVSGSKGQMTDGNTYVFNNETGNDPVINAEWNVHRYNVTYHYNATDMTVSDQTDANIAYNENYTIAGEDKFGNRVGYTLEKWTTEANGTGKEYRPGDPVSGLTAEDGATVDLYAQWKLDENEVTLVVPAGYGFKEKADETKSITYRDVQTFTVELDAAHNRTAANELTATVTGNGTVSFSKDGNTVTVTVTSTGEGDIKVTLGKAKLNTYSVTLQHENGSFDANVNGYNRPEVETSVKHGENVSFAITLLPAFSDSASPLVSITEGGTTRTVEPTGKYAYAIENVQGDIVITLKNADKNKSTLILNLAGGTITVDGKDYDEYTLENKVFGDDFEIPDPEKTGYTFKGWEKTEDSTGNGAISGKTYSFGTKTGTDTYVATWEAKTYTITFSQTAKEGDPAWGVITTGTLSKSVTFAGALPAIDNLPSRVGYDFLGYSLDEAGQTLWYDKTGAAVKTGSYDIANDTTLYAQWAKHQYKVDTVVGAGYNVTLSKTLVEYDEEYTFTVTADTGYDLSKAEISVTGSQSYAPVSVSEDGNVVTVTGVRGDNVITVNGEKLDVTLSVVLVNREGFAAVPGITTGLYGETGKYVDVTVADGYHLETADVSASPAVNFTLEQQDGTNTYRITVTDGLTEDVEITVTAKENQYKVILVGADAGENGLPGYDLPEVTEKDILYLGSGAFEITLRDGYTDTEEADIPYTVENGNAVLTKSGNTVTIQVSSTDPGNVTVTLGELKANEYNLTFINNGGETLALDPVPATISKIGHFDTFTVKFTVAKGYTADTPVLSSDAEGLTITLNRAEGSNEVTYTVSGFTGDTTLTLGAAKPNASTLTVDLDGGELEGVESEYPGVYKRTEFFGRPDKRGYTFNKWVLGGDKNGTLTGESSESAAYTFGPTAGAEDILTATYTANPYKIIYKYGVANVTVADVTDNVAFDTENVTLRGLGTFTRPGYTLTGWATSQGGQKAYELDANIGTYKITENTTLYAVWEVNSSTVELVLDGGSVEGELSFTGNYNATQPIPVPEKEGYDFTGWVLTGKDGAAVNGKYDAASKLYTFGETNGATDALTATWTESKYQIVYHYNVSGDNREFRQEVTFSKPVTLENDVFSRVGYSLSGWNTQADGSGTAYALNAPYGNYSVAGNTDLYAVWTANEYTVTYVNNDGEGNVVTETATYDAEWPVSPDTTREGYTFLGWFDAAEGGNKVTVTGAYKTAGDTTVYAQWKINEYTVTFVNKAGETVNLISAPANTVKWNESVTVEITLPAAYSNTDLDALLTSTGDVTVSHTGAARYTIEGIQEDITVTLNEAVRNTYTVTVAASKNGYTVNVEKIENVLHGTSVDVIATLLAGYSNSAAPASGLNNANATLVRPTEKVDGAYTYTLTNVTGNVTLTLDDADENTYNITVTAGTGYEVTDSGEPLPVYHKDGHESRTIVITLDDAYSKSNAPAATVNGGTLSGEKNGNTVTYTLTDITEDQKVVIGDADKNSYTVTVTTDANPGYTETHDATVLHEDGVAKIVLTLDDARSDSKAPVAATTDGTISAGEKTVVDGKTVYTYTLTGVTGNVEVHFSAADINTYEVILDATKVGYTAVMAPASPVQYDDDVVVTVTLEEGYSRTRTEDILATANRENITNVSRNGNVITYTVVDIREKTTIAIGNATVNTYDVSLNADGTGYTVTTAPVSSVTHNSGVTVVIELDDEYDRSSVPAVTVKSKHAPYNSVGTVASSQDGKTITYNVSYVTDDINIVIGEAALNLYTVTFSNGAGVKILKYPEGTEYTNGAQINANHGDTVQFTLERVEGYSTDIQPAAYIGLTALTPDENGVYTVVITNDTNIRTNSLEFIRYIANFVNWNNTFLASYMVPKGQTAEYYGADPVRPNTEYDTYTFTHTWERINPVTYEVIEGGLENMTEDRTFRAVFSVEHTLVWRYDDEYHWKECPGHPEETGTEKVRHNPAEAVRENEVPATCVAKGSYEAAVYCADCGKELSRETVITDFDFTNHVTDKTYVLYGYAATCSAQGYEGDHYCIACNHFAYEGRYLPIDENAHHWTNYVTVGDEGHSRVCELCGKEETAEHILREVYRIAATCAAGGETMYGCTVCGTQVNKVREATGNHLASDPYIENYQAGTCVTPETYDEVIYCRTCGIELSREEKTGAYGNHNYKLVSENVPATCTDTYTAVYECTICDASAEGHSYTVEETGEHTWSAWTVTEEPTEGHNGTETRTCAVCGTTETREVEWKPLGERQVQFISHDKVTYTMIDYDTKAEKTVSGYVKYYSNVSLKFKVTVSAGFGYAGYSVFVNGTQLVADNDGVYTVPAGIATANISVAGITPIDTGNNGGDSDNSGNQNSGEKLSFWQRLINFFKRLFSIFRR